MHNNKTKFYFKLHQQIHEKPGTRNSKGDKEIRVGRLKNMGFLDVCKTLTILLRVMTTVLEKLR